MTARRGVEAWTCRHGARVAAAAAFGVVTLAGCRPGANDTASDTAAGASTSPSAASAASERPGAATADSSAATCPAEQVWRECSVEKRLTDAGFVPKRDDEPSPSGIFPVPGVSYALGAAELHVYVFATPADRAAAITAIDTLVVARRGGANPWGQRPVLISTQNLAAVLLSNNERLIERVQNALTAGLPGADPGPPR